MNIILNRVDFFQIGATSESCLRIIHVDKKKKTKLKNFDKLVVGNQNGVLFCLERKEDETVVIFQTPPSFQICSVRLGGALNTIQDKTFIVLNNVVKGYTRKGKQFLNFESNIAEPIRHMYIYGVDMLLCGRNTMYHFHDCVEKNSFVCNDLINDVLCLPIVEGGWVGRGLTSIIACDDKTIKVIEKSNLVYEIELIEIVNILHLFMNDGGKNKQKVFYGTKYGSIGLVDLSATEGTILFEIKTKSISAINAIHFYQFLNDSDLLDLIIGKEDGLVELYTIDEFDSLKFCLQYQCDESITGLECGQLSSLDYSEIVISTYSGWIFALCLNNKIPGTSQRSITNSLITNENKTCLEETSHLEIKVQQLKIEIEELEDQLKIERKNYQFPSNKQKNKSTDDNYPLIVSDTTQPILNNMKDKFFLRKDLLCYILLIELAIPIDYIVIQSELKLDLLDIEKTLTVLSIMSSDILNKNNLLACYQCQTDTTRMEIRIRSNEGDFGELQIYVVPKFAPLMCQRRSYSIKPLALYERTHKLVSDDLPLNTLTLTGSFSIAEAHFWLKCCILEVSERCPPEENITLYFQSVFIKTILQANYTKGKVVFKSDNVSTIIILRDIIKKIWEIHQLNVHISCDFNNKSIEHVLNLIYPKLKYYSELNYKFKLAKGLKELETTFQDVSYLNSKLKDILKNYEQLSKEVVEEKYYSDRLIKVVKDLYIDKYKFLNQNIQLNERIEKLCALFDSEYDLNSLLEFFNEM